MNIRPALPSESSLFCALDHSQTFSAHWSAQAWQDELAQPAARVWGAFVEEKLVGFICVRGAAGQYEITNLAVHAAHTRQGIARALMHCALTFLQTTGGEQLSLEVSTRNKPARALYERCGLMLLGVRKKFYLDGSDALIMGKKL